MPGKTQAESKRDEIVLNAFERFYDGGFHATGVDAVLADTGISKRTLYRYFPSKEALISAVLDRYAASITESLFEPVLRASTDPREQILALFDVRQNLLDQSLLENTPLRGCLGMKAALEYLGKSEQIADHGRSFAAFIEMQLIELCERGQFREPVTLGRQINTLFQGAVLLSQVFGNTTPFSNARAAAEVLMNNNAP